MSASVVPVLRGLGAGEVAPPPAAAWSSSAPQTVSEQSARADDNVGHSHGASFLPEDAFIFPSLVRLAGADAYGSDFAAVGYHSQTSTLSALESILKSEQSREVTSNIYAVM